jgi:hypothetical protein
MDYVQLTEALASLTQAPARKKKQAHTLLPDLHMHLWQHQLMPTSLALSDEAQYYWHLQVPLPDGGYSRCGHLALRTISTVNRHIIKHGHLGTCYRCLSGYKHTSNLEYAGDDFHMSVHAQKAWKTLDKCLDDVADQLGLPSHTSLVGATMGYVVETQVLRNTDYGRLDIYIPLCSLVIEVDAHRHDKSTQMGVDLRVDSELNENGRHILRLHHKDEDLWEGAIREALQRCMHYGTQMLKMYTPSHHLVGNGEKMPSNIDRHCDS